MTARYWEALERQVEALRIVTSERAKKWGAKLWDPRVYADKDPSSITLTNLKFIRAGLEFGSPFFWSRRTIEVIAKAAPPMPAWTFTPESLPAAQGFMWFEEPLVLPRVEEISVAHQGLRAISFMCALRTEETDKALSDLRMSVGSGQ